MMKEEENENNLTYDTESNFNINNQLLNLENNNVENYNNSNLNNFNNNIKHKAEFDNNYSNYQSFINNTINTQNFQINFNQNFSNENEFMIFPNFTNEYQNSKNKNNQIIYSHLTIQDLNAINSIMLNDLSPQKIENNCHYLQMKILSNINYSNDILFPFLYPNMLSLINDQYGNSLYQSFIEVLNPKNLLKFLLLLKNNFLEISHSHNGTRVIQKLIEKSTILKQGSNIIQKYLIEMIKGNVYEFSNDENANHIIQKYIINIHYPNNNFIYEELYQNFMFIAITKYGCCVIQKCLISGNKEQKEKLIYLVLKNTFTLIRNQFGNYVYQCVLMLKDENINLKIIEIIYDNIIPLCKEKYSSNVIEKLFEINNPIIVNQLIDYITNSESKVIELLTNKYGNYIIQKILSICSDKNLFFRILNIISKNIITINNISFGKKIIQKLIEKYPLLKELINKNNN